MTLKFSGGLLLAALMYIIIGLASVGLWVALWSYSIGLANITIPLTLLLVIGWAAVIILNCMKYDRERSIVNDLLTHHKEALASEEGRPTDQPA